MSNTLINDVTLHADKAYNPPVVIHLQQPPPPSLYVPKRVGIKSVLHFHRKIHFSYIMYL